MERRPHSRDLATVFRPTSCAPVYLTVTYNCRTCLVTGHALEDDSYKVSTVPPRVSALVSVLMVDTPVAKFSQPIGAVDISHTLSYNRDH